MLGIVDDNPGLVDNLSASYPGSLFLYDIKQHDRNDIDIIPCLTWDDVVEAVKQKFT